MVSREYFYGAVQSDPCQNAHVEESLIGGVANAGKVTRKGEFVLRPSNLHSASIHEFLRALRSAGFEGASFPIEIQDDGREQLVFVEGIVPVPPYPAWAQSDGVLESVTNLMFDFHRASAILQFSTDAWSQEMADPYGGSIICHNDVCLENVVFRDGQAVALLDFDFAAPGRPIYDLAAFARMCVPIDDDIGAERLGWFETDRPGRLRLVADTYGLDGEGRKELLESLDGAMRSGGAFVQRRVDAGDQNFNQMLDAMGGMERYARRGRWWTESRQEFLSALA